MACEGGYERIQEIEDPEIATQRTRAIYKAKGYNDGWIEKRMRGIAIREELIDEWDKRGIKLQREYAILTAEISKATFGLTPSEYKKHKGLDQENLRDHMTDLELIFSMLGEAATKEITVNRDAKVSARTLLPPKWVGRLQEMQEKNLSLKVEKKLLPKKIFSN